MEKIFSLDEGAQERLIVKKFLFLCDPAMEARPAPTCIVLADRDGTLIKERRYIRDPDELEFEPGAVSALKQLQDFGAFVVVVSNQAGLAKGKMTFDDFTRVNHRFLFCLKEEGIKIQAVIYCPFHDEGIIPEYKCASPFRKPSTGMYRIIQKELGLNSDRLFVIGDKVSDAEFGNRLQADTFFVTTGHGTEELPTLQKSGLTCKVKENLSEAVNEIVGNPTAKFRG